MNPENWFWIGVGAIAVYALDAVLYLLAHVHLRWLRRTNREINEMVEREKKRLRDLDHR